MSMLLHRFSGSWAICRQTVGHEAKIKMVVLRFPDRPYLFPLDSEVLMTFD